MKLSEINPRDKFYVDNKGGIFQIEASVLSNDENNNSVPDYTVKCLCCNSIKFMSADTEVYTLEYGTPEYRKGYEEGNNDREIIMMQHIERWDGSTNSTLGDLLNKKFQELYNKLERGK